MTFLEGALAINNSKKGKNEAHVQADGRQYIF